MSSPTVSHWATVEHILRYLKEALGRGILYKKHEHTRIECCSDNLRNIVDPPQDIVSFLVEI